MTAEDVEELGCIQCEALKSELDDAVAQHRSAHQSWRDLMEEHNQLRTKVAVVDIALRDLLHEILLRMEKQPSTIDDLKRAIDQAVEALKAIR